MFCVSVVCFLHFSLMEVIFPNRVLYKIMRDGVNHFQLNCLKLWLMSSFFFFEGSEIEAKECAVNAGLVMVAYGSSFV